MYVSYLSHTSGVVLQRSGSASLRIDFVLLTQELKAKVTPEAIQFLLESGFPPNHPIWGQTASIVRK